MQRKLDACNAFAAPYTVVVSNTADHRSLSAACDRNQVIMVATELAGSAHVNPKALQIGYDGVLRYLKHFGVIENAPEASAPTRYVETPRSSYFVWATMDGIFEPSVQPGDQVSAGSSAGYIYPLNDPFKSAEELFFAEDGVVVAMHMPATLHRGQYVYQVAADVKAENLV
jgi:predicted deacylase